MPFACVSLCSFLAGRGGVGQLDGLLDGPRASEDSSFRSGRLNVRPRHPPSRFHLSWRCEHHACVIMGRAPITQEAHQQRDRQQRDDLSGILFADPGGVQLARPEHVDRDDHLLPHGVSGFPRTEVSLP